jgi:nucleotide-binding universal stress UspA family protein
MEYPLIKNVLTLVDGSDSSINAAKYAIDLSDSIKTELFALYVINTTILNELSMLKIIIKEESNDFKEKLEINGRMILSYIEELALKNNVKINKILKSGNLTTLLFETCEENKIDLIIMGKWLKNDSNKNLTKKFYDDILIELNKPIIIVS